MLRVISLFCGAGFSDAALYRASEESGIPVKVVGAYDSWDRAVKVYNANLPPIAEVRDVKQMTRSDFPPHDLVIGGPPCQNHSLAGPRDCRCNVGGVVSPRCCLADFVRLCGSRWIIENVRSRLISAPYSVKLNASRFGDVTTRKRWFYSSEVLRVVETPGSRRIRDIREPGADERALTSRGEMTERVARKKAIEEARQGQTYNFPPRRDDDFIGSLGATSSHRLQSGSTLLKIGMRGHSASASAFEDTAFLGSFVANSWHGNEHSKLEGCRNPTLLEMQRAHSVPDEWDWAGVTKVNRGQMIANGWPRGLGTAVLKAALTADCMAQAA